MLLIVAASAGRDFYKILNVPKSAPTDQIKKAYRWQKFGLRHDWCENDDDSDDDGDDEADVQMMKLFRG